MQNIKSTRMLTTLAMLAALSIVLVALIHLPLFPAVPYLQYDPADIPIMIGTFMFGPWIGLLLTAVVSIIQGMTVSADGGVIGIIMHFIATGTFVLCSGFIYRKMKETVKGAILGLSVGVLAMTVIMILWNLILTPIYMGMPRAAIIDLLPWIIAFNLIKAGANALITLIVYQPLSKIIGKEKRELA